MIVSRAPLCSLSPDGSSNTCPASLCCSLEARGGQPIWRTLRSASGCGHRPYVHAVTSVPPRLIPIESLRRQTYDKNGSASYGGRPRYRQMQVVRLVSGQLPANLKVGLPQKNQIMRWITRSAWRERSSLANLIRHGRTRAPSTSGCARALNITEMLAFFITQKWS
jgi:hypothetical protein